MAQKFYNKDGKEIQRVRCQKYSRVSGFITPVDNYNIGKKAEFYSRKFYSMEESMNSKFIAEYSCDSNDMNTYDVVKKVSDVSVACVDCL